ncbi:hypothetical protein DYB32_002307 [Aphanomyces invadans]|uniref:Uncharacterized protein n=1 Tax=Aphanomyces invadans TaxID=157072 RepID=A0A418B3V7_9STRA|nr:hypothetical protein DYB32_002307 [Aphanomyces invadans]
MATSIAVNCNQLGIAMVYVLLQSWHNRVIFAMVVCRYILCPFFVTSIADIAKWTALVAAFSVAALLLALCKFRASSKFANMDEEASYNWHQWVSAFHHDGFFLTVLVFAVAEMVTNVLSSLLNHILRADVFSKPQKGLIGAAFIVSALIGGQVVSGYIDGTRSHKVALVVCLVITGRQENSPSPWKRDAMCVVAGASLVSFHFAASAVFAGQMYITMGCLMLAGLFLGPLQPVSLELATVAALQQLCGNFLSAVMVPILGAIQHAAEEVHEQQAADPAHVALTFADGGYWVEAFSTPEVVLSVFIFVAAFLFCGLYDPSIRYRHTW